MPLSKKLWYYMFIMKFGIFVSDAKPMSERLIQRAVNFLLDNGIECIIDDRCYVADTPEKKAAIINSYYHDSEIDGLMAFWGGVKTIELLPRLDKDIISQSSKPLIGYSDTTALLIAVARLGGTAIHGPALITFAKKFFQHESLQSLLYALGEDSIDFNHSVPTVFNSQPMINAQALIQETHMQFYRTGEAKGTVIAGNLQTLLLLNGTPYEIDLRSKILFLEEAEEVGVDYFKRYLSQLMLMKDFSMLKGIVFSYFTSPSGIDHSLLTSILDEYGIGEQQIPIITGYLSGHCDPILSVKQGVVCSITQQEGRPVITFSNHNLH